MGRISVWFIQLFVTPILLAAHAARAFEVGPSTIDGGGGTSSGGVFTLTGTIGQPDAATSAGGGFTLQGGFWTAVTVPTSTPEDGLTAVPTVYRLYPNAPNPFNPTTAIRFDLPQPGRAVLRVFDLRGRLIRVLLDTGLPAGRHTVTWDGRDRNGIAVSSGVYMLLMEAGHFTARRKMTTLK